MEFDVEIKFDFGIEFDVRIEFDIEKELFDFESEFDIKTNASQICKKWMASIGFRKRLIKKW